MLIVEEFVDQREKNSDPRTYNIVTCSGHTSYSLKENQQRLLQYLKSNPSVQVADLAYTTTVRRMHHAFRSSFCVQTTGELTKKLDAYIAKTLSVKTSGYDRYSSVVWVFTGQGSFYQGAGKQLFQTSSRFRDSIFSYQRVCDLQGLPHVVDLISDSGSKHTKDATVVQMQLAMVFLQLALADLWGSWGVRPTLLIGHSLGEYSALCVSGVLSVSDTLYLVGKRSSILQDRSVRDTHAMLAVNMASEDLKVFMNTKKLSSCGISCRNSPNQTVASGTIKDLKQLESHLRDYGSRSKMLQVPYAFHSPQVEPILDEFRACAVGIEFARPKIPVVSTLSKAVVTDTGHFTPSYLTRQMREPVDFRGALQECQEKGLVDDQTMWVEFGPEPTCLGMIRSCLGETPSNLLATIKSNEDNWKTISTSLSAAYAAKIPIDWKAYHQDYLDSLTLLALPAYAFDLKDFWSLYNQDTMGTGVSKNATAEIDTAPVSANPLTTCLQYLTNESISCDAASATFVSYTSNSSLCQVIQGHVVDGVPICPASAFCDMAYTAAGYLYAKANPGEASPADLSLQALDITSPVVLDESGPPKAIEVTATKLDDEWSIGITFQSGDSSRTPHGRCKVLSRAKGSWKNDITRSLHLVKKRMEAIIKESTCGNGHRLLKPIVYKLFSELVRYSESYQGLEEVFLDATGREAVGRIKLRHNLNVGRYTQNPYWLDSIAHLAGFILNGDVNKADDVAYVTTGIAELYVLEELSQDQQYTSYACVQDTENKDELVADIYIFKGEAFVSLCAGASFHKMLKKTFAAITSRASRAFNSTTPSNNATTGPKAQMSYKSTPGAVSSTAPTETTKPTTLTNGDTVNESSSSPRAVKTENQDIGNLLLGIVASETGVDVEDLEPATAFSDIGVDSLMSITILSAAQNKLGIEMPASFFFDHPTVKELMQAFSATEVIDDSSHSADLPSPGSSNEESSTNISNSTPDDIAPTPDTSDDEPKLTNGAMANDKSPIHKQSPAVSSNQAPLGRTILLQGRASSTETPVYLFTDGAGSATAYIHLPALPGGRRLFAVESPYLQNPTDWHCSLEEYCSLYVTTLQQSQPHGPYIIGGWSAGAVYAFEVTRQLLEEKGEQVKCLFMMDMRVPRPMPDALEPTMELIEQAGLLTGMRRSGVIEHDVSTRLKEHLVSNVKALKDYQPQPINPARRPGKSFMLWARQGLRAEVMSRFKGKIEEELNGIEGNVMEDENTGLKGWFFAKRTVFGPNGWDKLVGDIECDSMDADHFSMLTPPKVSSGNGPPMLLQNVRKC